LRTAVRSLEGSNFVKFTKANALIWAIITLFTLYYPAQSRGLPHTQFYFSLLVGPPSRPEFLSERGPMDALLRTKLIIPGTQANLVQRTRLEERLNTRLDKKHPLIVAAAGSEKTTLLVEWLKQIDLPRFLAYLAAAHQLVEEKIGTILLSALQSPQLPAIKTENTNASHN
jgi:hypothetical protein